MKLPNEREFLQKQLDKYGEVYREGDNVCWNNGADSGYMKSIDLENDTMVTVQFPYGVETFSEVNVIEAQRDILNNPLSKKMRSLGRKPDQESPDHEFAK